MCVALPCSHTTAAKRGPPAEFFPYADGGKAGISKAEQGPRKGPQDGKKKREVLVWQPQAQQKKVSAKWPKSWIEAATGRPARDDGDGVATDATMEAVDQPEQQRQQQQEQQDHGAGVELTPTPAQHQQQAGSSQGPPMNSGGRPPMAQTQNAGPQTEDVLARLMVSMEAISNRLDALEQPVPRQPVPRQNPLDEDDADLDGTEGFNSFQRQPNAARRLTVTGREREPRRSASTDPTRDRSRDRPKANVDRVL